MKILFEDAATGARSPALVRQGQIGEIVNAKPEQRRRILEDAAGIAGLHSRRHEAELRLKAAEANLARVTDVAGPAQFADREPEAAGARRRDATRRSRPRSGSQEALVLHLSWMDAQELVETEEAGLREALAALGAGDTMPRPRALAEEARLAEGMRPLREEEAKRAAVLAPSAYRAARTSSARRAGRWTACASSRPAPSSSATISTREDALIAEAREILASLDAGAYRSRRSRGRSRCG